MLTQSVQDSLHNLRTQVNAAKSLLDTMEEKITAKEKDWGIDIPLLERQFEQLSNITKRMHAVEDHLWDTTSPKLAEKVDQGLDYQLATKEHLQEGV